MFFPKVNLGEFGVIECIFWIDSHHSSTSAVIVAELDSAEEQIGLILGLILWGGDLMMEMGVYVWYIDYGMLFLTIEINGSLNFPAC